MASVSAKRDYAAPTYLDEPRQFSPADRLKKRTDAVRHRECSMSQWLLKREDVASCAQEPYCKSMAHRMGRATCHLDTRCRSQTFEDLKEAGPNEWLAMLQIRRSVGCYPLSGTRH
jgi:hypothetical protein